MRWFTNSITFQLRFALTALVARFVTAKKRSGRCQIDTFMALAFCGLFLVSTSSAQQTAPTPLEGNRTRSKIYKFFLQAPPTETQVEEVTKNSRALLIAKVRIVNTPPLFLPRHNAPPLRKSNYTYYAKVKVLEVMRGKADLGEMLEVYFLLTNSDVTGLVVPLWNQLDREYYILSDLDESGVRIVLGVRGTLEEYGQWLIQRRNADEAVQ
jgi:hypothetical protein